jgi:CheY-like chemotaxis protein
MTTLSPVNDYVLYADDDEDDRAMMIESFAKHAKNKELVCVSNGEELFEYLRVHVNVKGLPCLVIIDQNMPLLSGDKIAERLKSDGSLTKIPLVVFSTYSGINAKLYDHLQVPVIIKPNSFQQWETIALTLLAQCGPFKDNNAIGD